METFNKQIKEKTDDELVEIYIKQHNYQPEFSKAVEEELNVRGIALAPFEVSKKIVHEMSDESYERGLPGNRIYITLCFVASLLGFVFFIPLIAGYIYRFSKRKDPYGVSYYNYNEQTRKYGKWMLILTVVMLVFWAVVRGLRK